MRRDPVTQKVPLGRVPRVQQPVVRLGVVGVEGQQLHHGGVHILQNGGVPERVVGLPRVGDREAGPRGPAAT